MQSFQPQTIAPGASVNFVMNAQAKEKLLANNPVDGNVFQSLSPLVSTLDQRKYAMTFTISFVIKNHALERSFILDGPITAQK